jgi:hypothetical protein
MYTHSKFIRSSMLSSSLRKFLLGAGRADGRKIWLGGAAAALFMVACQPAAAQAVNLVSNGSFETGDFDGWYHTSSGQPPGTVAYDPSATATEPTNGLSPDAPGDYLAVYYADLDKESFEQKVYLLPGNYTAGFSAYPFSYQNPYQETLGFYVGNTLVTSINSANVTGNQWYLMSGTFTIASAGWYDVELKYKSGKVPARDMLIDLVYLICTPQTTC